MDSASAFATSPQTTAGLGGLAAPMAQQLQGFGRNGDSMLVHMTPGEVGGLQSLAQSMGGSLSINPDTGLPEANFLRRILPMLAGFGLNFFLPGVGSAVGKALGGIGSAAGTGVTVGAAATAISGDINKGLMAGLGAFGGASLGGALKSAGALKTAATAPPGVSEGLQQAATTPLQSNALGATQLGKSPVVSPGLQQAARTALPTPMANIAPVQAGNFAAQQPGFLSRFGGAASEGMKGTVGKAAPYVAGLGLLNSMSAPPAQPKPQEDDGGYAGPYRFERRQVRMPTVSPAVSRDSSEFTFFDTSQPRLLDNSGNAVGGFGSAPPGGMAALPVYNGPAFLRPQQSTRDPFRDPIWNTFAAGGEVGMEDGSFVVDARTVSELGNGSSEAGQELLARMGGMPIKGKGDGVSDSVPANIGGTQKARVARDEVVFSPAAVQRIGGGSAKRGTEKLYALMDKAHKARQQAKRGQDTGLRKGLA